MDATASHIIAALGGTTAVAQLIKTPVSTVQSWRRIGIPASRLDHIKLAAAAAGKQSDFDAGMEAAGSGHEALPSNGAPLAETGNVDEVSAQVAA